MAFFVVYERFIFYTKRGSILKKILLLILSAVVLTSCKPTYEAPVDAPETAVRSESDPYEIDFVQINNNVIETFQDDYYKSTFPFIKNLEIDGSNETMTCELKLEVDDNVSGDAVIALLTNLTLDIGEEGQMQDFRFELPNGKNFGTFFDKYSYHYVVTQSSQTIMDDTISAGDEMPFDPSLTIDKIQESIASASRNGSVGDQTSVSSKEK